MSIRSHRPLVQQMVNIFGFIVFLSIGACVAAITAPFLAEALGFKELYIGIGLIALITFIGGCIIAHIKSM